MNIPFTHYTRPETVEETAARERREDRNRRLDENHARETCLKLKARS